MPFHISHIRWITKHIDADSFPKIKVKKWKFVWIFVVVDSRSHFLNQKGCGLWLCSWRLSSFLFWRILEKQKVLVHHHQLASARMIQWNWKLYCPRPLAHIAPSSLLSAITWAAISWPWWCANTQSTTEDRDLVFFYFCNNKYDGIVVQNLRVDFENTAGATIANWNWGGTRPLSASLLFRNSEISVSSWLD